MEFSFFVFLNQQRGRIVFRWTDKYLLFQNKATELAEKTTGLLLSALNDLEQPFSAELDEAATSVTSCLNNVLQSASGQSNGAAEEAKVGLRIL